MAVLSNVDIEKVIKKNKGIIIMNMCNENLTGVGYDFTIGFICDSDTGKEPDKIKCIFDTESGKEYVESELLSNPELKEEYEEYERNKETNRYKQFNRYILWPRKRYLVISKEYIVLMNKYMATLHSRGSYALKGIIVTSTTIDPNYRGFIYASLINCSKKKVYIKECNQFVTMVIHKFITPTNIELHTTDNGMPKDAEQTLNGRFSNISKETVALAKTYRTDSWKKIEREFEVRYNKNLSMTARLVDWCSEKGMNYVGKIISKKEFWIILIVLVMIIASFICGGVDKVLEVLPVLKNLFV